MVFSSENLSPEEVRLAYKTLTDRHSRYSKLQSEGAVLYVKWLAIFLGAAFVFLIVLGRNSTVPIVNWLLVVFLGIASLGFFFTIMRQDFQYDREVIRSVKIGKQLEEKYPSIISSRYFHFLDDDDSYRALLFGRFAPAALLALLTAATGIYLSAGFSFFLAVGVGLLSLAATVVAIRFFSRTIKWVHYCN